MRRLGLLLITIGFFGAAFFAVRRADSAGLEWRTIEWNYYLSFFVAGALGVVLLRTSVRGAKTHAHKLDADLQTMKQSIASLVTKLRNLRNGRDQIGVYEVHDRIDAELVEDLARFVDARESLIALYGLQSYADLMNEFAGCERNINRAWCASADGYVDEVWTCLDHAATQMTRTRRLLADFQIAPSVRVGTRDVL